MKLTDEQLRAAASGAVRAWQTEEGFHLCRFTQTQADAYRQRRLDFYDKALSPSGVVLRFRTDSPTLTMAVPVQSGSSRVYFSLDIVVNGTEVGRICNFEQVDIRGNYCHMDETCGVRLGVFSGTFDLGAGEKLVEIYLPWSVRCAIRSLELAGRASFAPVKREKKLLAFGDSITHGYDALSPRNKYITRLADALGMEEINKAIGGETFWPELAAMKDDLWPDLITVAYGTNDWSNLAYEEAAGNCMDFYANLRAAYPGVPIVALTPVWRTDWEKSTEKFGPITKAEEMIRRAAAALDGVTVIRGWELIPQDTALYGDLSLHPSDEGFRYYFENLLKALQEK